MIATDERQPWERQAGESRQAFAAFAAYRDAGTTRGVAKVAAACKKSASLLYRWSTDWHWQDRVTAWDDEQDRLRREAYQDEVLAMGRRQADEARALQAVITAAATHVLQRMADDPTWLAQLDSLPVDQALGLIARLMGAYPAVMKAERLARGVATEKRDERVVLREEARRHARKYGLSYEEVLREAEEIMGWRDGG